MPPKELYSIECLESDAARDQLASRLPMLANPIPGEALTAWLHRFASQLKLPPTTLLIDAEEGELPRDDTWWRNPPLPLLERIAARTGATIEVLKTMTFENWHVDRTTDEVIRRFARGRVRYRLPSCATRRYGLCPTCVATDQTPYLRKHWTLGWVVACERHRVRLHTTCTCCRAGYMIPLVKDTARFEFHQCSGPGCALTDQREEPAHPGALRLQKALMDGRAERAIQLPCLGTVGWALAIAVIDFVLHVAWTPVDPFVRRRCYQSLERELNYEGTLKGNSHDGLTIASWILDDWPDRLHWLTRQLGLPAPEQCLGVHRQLATDDREQLRQLLRLPGSSRTRRTEGADS